MRLSPTERLILINQYEILNRLSQGSPYDDYIKVLRSGFELEIEDRLFTGIDEVGFSRQACLEVMNILAMFDHLITSFEKLADKQDLRESDVKFRGFDSHSDEEVGYWQYALHLVENQKRFLTKASDLKGFFPMLSKYREAIELWVPARDRHHDPDLWLSAGEIKEIIAPLSA